MDGRECVLNCLCYGLRSCNGILIRNLMFTERIKETCRGVARDFCRATHNFFA